MPAKQDLRHKGFMDQDAKCCLRDNGVYNIARSRRAAQKEGAQESSDVPYLRLLRHYTLRECVMPRNDKEIYDGEDSE